MNIRQETVITWFVGVIFLSLVANTAFSEADVGSYLLVAVAATGIGYLALTRQWQKDCDEAHRHMAVHDDEYHDDDSGYDGWLRRN